MLRFTIDVSKKNVEPMELFFHNFEHDGKNFEADPTIVQKLGIAIRDAICSVLFIKVVNSVDELKIEVQKASKTKIDVRMTLNDAMHIVGAFSPDSLNKEILKARGEAAIKRMAEEVDKIVECLDDSAEGDFY